MMNACGFENTSCLCATCAENSFFYIGEPGYCEYCYDCKEAGEQKHNFAVCDGYKKKCDNIIRVLNIDCNGLDEAIKVIKRHRPSPIEKNIKQIADEPPEVPNFYCGDCIYWKYENVNQAPCKRIDHKNIKFAIPCFASYDGNQHGGIICSDFEPKNKFFRERWEGFEKYFPLYVDACLPYKNTDTLVYFTLHNDTSVKYGVHMMDFVYGTMIDGNTLKAVEKVYYKQIRNPGGFNYRLIRDPINGVKIILDEKTESEE